MTASLHIFPVAWMYPSDLEDFTRQEMKAAAWSIQVGCVDSAELSVPLFAQAAIDTLQERIDALEKLNAILVAKVQDAQQ